MIEKDAAGTGQRHSARPAHKQLRADFVLKVPQLPAQRWLGRVKPAFRGFGQASRLRHGDEISKVTQFHEPCLTGMAAGYAKSL